MTFTALSELGINTDHPTQPNLRSHAARMNTFTHYANPNVSAADLAAAGFYRRAFGIADMVCCFWCDGALQDWSEGDDAWTEHAK